MEERREMNEQRMMTNEELRSRVASLNAIAREKETGFAVEYAEKTTNNVIQGGYALKDETNVAPVIYPSEQWTSLSDEELVEFLRDLREKLDAENQGITIMKRLFDISREGELLKRVYPRVVSAENADRFEKDGIVFDRYLDMLVIYTVELDEESDMIASFQLHEEHIKAFGIDFDALRESAFKNLEKIVDYLELDTGDFKMIVGLRKDKQIGGAATMLLPNVRKELAERFGTDKLVFLPSSVSEVIAVRQDGTDPDGLLEMVHEVNDTAVNPLERLTDSIYPMQLWDGEYRLSVIRP